MGLSDNIVRNVPNSDSHYWTWDITANKRFSGRWSLVAGFAHTWNRDQASGYSGQPVRQNTYPLTPNDLINAGAEGRYEFRTWTAKVHGTYQAPWDLRITPFLRHQSGQPFGRTFSTSLNYGNTSGFWQSLSARAAWTTSRSSTCAWRKDSACRRPSCRGVRRGLQHVQRQPGAENQPPLLVRHGRYQLVTDPARHGNRVITGRSFPSNADADRHDAEFWRQLPAEQRVLLVWRLSVEQWQLPGRGRDEPGLCRSVASVRRA